jgi:hypothetical protein
MASHFGADEDDLNDMEEPNRKATAGKMLLQPLSKTSLTE